MAPLTAYQARFLAERPWCATDKEACEEAGVTQAAVCLWKKQPDFKAAYDSIWAGDLARSKMLLARLRDKAAMVIEDALSSKNKGLALRAAQDLLDRVGVVKGQEVALGNLEGLRRLVSEAEQAENTDKEE